MPISNVSDTALWVALYRAVESERPDALFKDPLARRLAGPEGERIARELGGRAGMAAAMAVRTRLIDELILRAVSEEGVDLVVNLACGLDARPYRLRLPERLRWVEADLPGLLELKESRLDGAVPHCRLERFKVDLSKADERRSVLAQALEGSRKALVLTEGLLCYLLPENAEELACGLREDTRIQLWISDLFSPAMIPLIRRSWGRRLEQGNAPIHFGARPEEFAAWGWRAREVRSIYRECPRYRRDFAAAALWRPMVRLLPARARRFFEESYTIALFEARAEAT